jgi:hypothetical protein
MDRQFLGKLSLTQASCNPRRNQELAQALKIPDLIELPTLAPSIALDFLLKLEVKGVDGIDRALHVSGRQARLLQLGLLHFDPFPLFTQASYGFAVFIFVTSWMVSNLDDPLRLAVAPRLPEGGREFQFMPILVSNAARVRPAGILRCPRWDRKL